MQFHCTDCGKCCLEGAGMLKATQADIRLWEKEAPHLLAYVRFNDDGGGDLWFGPKPLKATTRCLWIRKRNGEDRYYCRIYAHRPTVCRNYPVSPDHAKMTDCPGTFDE